MTQRSLTVHPCGCLTLYCFRQRSSIHEGEYQADLKHLLFSPMLRGRKNCFPQFFFVCFIYVRRFPDVTEARWNTVAKPPNVVKVCCERRQGVFWLHQGCKLAFQPHRSNNTQSIGLSFFSALNMHMQRLTFTKLQPCVVPDKAGTGFPEIIAHFSTAHFSSPSK